MFCKHDASIIKLKPTIFLWFTRKFLSYHKQHQQIVLGVHISTYSSHYIAPPRACLHVALAHKQSSHSIAFCFSRGKQKHVRLCWVSRDTRQWITGYYHRFEALPVLYGNCCSIQIGRKLSFYVGWTVAGRFVGVHSFTLKLEFLTIAKTTFWMSVKFLTLLNFTMNLQCLT